MNKQSPSHLFSELLDKLGLAIGLAAAFMLVMPLYEKAYPLFKLFVLSYTPHPYQDVVIVIWWLILFFVLTSTARFIVMALVNIFSSILSVLAVKFTLWRNGRG